MNRRGFFRGLLAIGAIIPSVSTKTIVDMAANTWRLGPAEIGFYGATPVDCWRIRYDDLAFRWVFPEHLTFAGLLDATETKQVHGRH